MLKSVTEARIYHEVASLRDSSLLGPSVCCLLVCLSVVCCLLVLQPVYPGTELASEMTQNPAQKSLEDMTSSDVVQWLSKFAGQKFNQDIFDAIEGNELDGEALVGALEHGPDALKEVIPSLGKRLKLIHVLKNIHRKDQIETSSARSTPTPTKSLLKDHLSCSSLSSPASQDFNSTESVDDLVFANDGLEKDSLQQEDGDTIRLLSAHDSSEDETSISQGFIPKRTGASKFNHRKIIGHPTSSQSTLTMGTFHVPVFRSATEKNLKESISTDQDRKYIVRTLATILMSHVPSPKMDDCAIAAKALVAKYPFLGDTDTSPHYSWMKFISMRCSNVNRPDPDDSQQKKRKLEKIKLKDTTKHDYPQIPVCDDVSYERNMTRLSKEIEKIKPNNDVLVDLMHQTFPNRRQWIISDEHPVSLVCEKFPLLKSPGHISRKFEMVVKQPECYVKFKEAWLSKWSPAILKIAKADKIKIDDEDDMQGMDELPEDFLTQAAFQVLVKLVVPLRKVKQVSMSPLKRLLHTVKKGTPYEEIRPPTSHPVIVVLKDIDDSSQDRYYIMIEQVMLHDTPDFTLALFLLLSVHYVFNLEYDTCVLEPLLFLQEFVAGIKDTSIKYSALFSSVTSRITRQL